MVKRQRRVLAQFWRSDVQGSGATGLVSNKSSVHGLQMAAYSVSLVCVCGQGEKKVEVGVGGLQREKVGGRGQIEIEREISSSFYKATNPIELGPHSHDLTYP